MTAEYLRGVPTDDLLAEVIERAERFAAENRERRDVGREFSLAVTAAEEARWRFRNGADHARATKPSDAIRERLTERAASDTART